ncbi:acyltransferase family-domain-containing protein [Nemania sp. FL0031]|nr:acyltransferase family-domain-containing protein [Nemania sp. FL0031]
MSLIWFSWDIHNGWTDWNDHLIQLPIIRLVISGRPNVMIFFVISGYALSNKPLSLIRKGEYPKMYQGLASSIFRRHPRLFVPAVLICLPAWPIAYFGGFNGEAMPGAAIGTKNPPRFDTIWGQFGNYVTTLLALSDIYSPTDIDWAYSDSLWTLPIEFKGSLVIFTMLIALSRCTTRARVFITLGVAFYSFWYFHWGELLFIGGMLAVELGLRSQRSDRAERAAFDDAEVRRSKLFWSAPFRTKAFRRLCGIAAFLAALLILGMPEQGRGAPNSYGFKILSELIPAHFHAGGAADYFWRPLGAIFVVLVIDNVRFLQKIFTTRLAQYLGRVSFALYLVHMLILHSLGFWLGKYFLQLTGSESYWRYAAGVSLAALVDGCVTIWAADLGSRFVDAKAVRFTVWAYGKLCKRTVEK